MGLVLIFNIIFDFYLLPCIADAWYPMQDPHLWNTHLIQEFDLLPIKNALIKNEIPWTSTYWADFQSGIAHRWESNFPEDYSYIPPSLARLKQMILSEKNKLSPAEKWDIYNSNYDYPTVFSERKRTRADQVKWAGLCHGWSLGSLGFNEPNSFHLFNSEGIEFDLFSTDIKALVSLAVSEQAINDSLLLGTKCDRSGSINRTNLDTSQCQGVNAGTFHLVMSNSLGVQKKPFVANVSRDQEIWNHPAYGYESEVIAESGPSRQASIETVREIRVETYLYIVEMQDPLTPGPVQGTIHQPLGSMKYIYWLELNAQGNVVGGKWETFWHPGFIWKNKSPIREFSGDFIKLNNLITSRASSM